MIPFNLPLGSCTLAGVRRQGTGPTVVFAHGFGGSRADWQQVLNYLPPQRSIVAYDLRGFGASRTDGATYSHAEDLLPLLDGLDIASADICGLSLGGGAALDFALDHPERVRRLVLVSPLMNGWAWSRDWIDRWKAIGSLARNADLEGARQLWWRHPLFDQVRQTGAATTMRAAIGAYHGDQWIEDNQRVTPSDIGRLKDLQVPTLLLTGKRDIPDFRGIAEAIARTAPNVSWIDFADAGHMLNLEIPQRIANEIGRFVS